MLEDWNRFWRFSDGFFTGKVLQILRSLDVGESLRLRTLTDSKKGIRTLSNVDGGKVVQ